MTDAGPRLPYPGLRAFARDEADLFFGRDSAVNDMVDKLARTRFLAVLGASGTGKSSLVKTGLLDGLELGLHHAGSNWLFCTISPGGQPMANLAAGLLLLEQEDEAQGDTVASRVDALEWFLRRGPRSLIEWVNEGHLPEGAQLLVLVDQFEELFRFGGYSDREEAEAFVKLLIEATSDPESRIHVVLTMRSEFLSACALIPGLAETINAGSYLTPRMSREECREAIVGPARMVGAEIEPALVNTILNDLVGFAPWGNDASLDPLLSVSRRADQLPVMQHLLNRLWRQADKSAGRVVLTLDAYRSAGKLGGALDAHGEEILGGLSNEQRAVAEKAFRALVDGSSPVAATRRALRFGDIVAEIGTTPEILAPVIEAFRDNTSNFLRPGPLVPLSDQVVIDISHESLIRQWSKLSGWVTEEARAANYLRRLANAEERYRQQEGDLLTGLDLANLNHWWRTDRPDATWARRYIDNFPAVGAFLGESESKDLERRNEEQNKENRHKRRLQFLTAFSLTLAVAAGLFYLRSEGETRQARDNYVMVENATEQLALGMLERFESGLYIPTAARIELITDAEKALQSLTSQAGRENALLEQRAAFYARSVEALLTSGHISVAADLAQRFRQLADGQQGNWRPDAELELAMALSFARIERNRFHYAAALLELDRAAELHSAMEAGTPGADIGYARLLQERAQLHLDFNQYPQQLTDAEALIGFYAELLDRLDALILQGEGLDSAELQAMQKTVSSIAEVVIQAGRAAIVSAYRVNLKERTGTDPLVYLEVIEAALAGIKVFGLTDARDVRSLEASVATARAWYEDNFGAGPASAHAKVTEAITLYEDLVAEDRSNISYREDLLYALVLRLGYSVDVGDDAQAEADAVASRSVALDLRLSGEDSSRLRQIEPWISYDEWRINSGNGKTTDANFHIRRMATLGATTDEEGMLPPALGARALYAWAALPKDTAGRFTQQEMIAIVDSALGAFDPGLAVPADRYYALTQRQFALQRALELGLPTLGREAWMRYHEMSVRETNELIALAPQVEGWRANVQYYVGLAIDAYGALDDVENKRTKSLEALALAIQLLQEKPSDETYFGNAILYAVRYVDTLSPGPELEDELTPLTDFLTEVVEQDRHWEPLSAVSSYVDGLITSLKKLQDTLGGEASPPQNAIDTVALSIERLRTAVVRANVNASESAVVAQAELASEAISVAPQREDLRQLVIANSDGVAAQLNWAHPPLFDGAWRTLDGQEFNTVLASLSGQLSADETQRVSLIRKTRLSFYDAGSLVEVQIGTEAVKLRTFLTFTTGDLYELNGTSPPIHAANVAAPLSIGTADQAADYLRFFTLFVNSEFGAFRIVEHSDELFWNGQQTLNESTNTQKVMRPLILWRDKAQPTVWKATATVNYSNSLFNAAFVIQPSGMVEMEGDVATAADLNVFEVRISDRIRGTVPVSDASIRLKYERLALEPIDSLYEEVAVAISASARLPQAARQKFRLHYTNLLLQPEAAALIVNYSTALNTLAYSMLVLDDGAEQALLLARRANEALPDNPYILDTYAWALTKTGDAAAAVPLLEKAAELDSSQAEIFAHLGQAYRLTGAPEKARSALDKAAGLEPTAEWLAFIQAERALLEAR